MINKIFFALLFIVIIIDSQAQIVDLKFYEWEKHPEYKYSLDYSQKLELDIGSDSVELKDINIKNNRIFDEAYLRFLKSRYLSTNRFGYESMNLSAKKLNISEELFYAVSCDFFIKEFENMIKPMLSDKNYDIWPIEYLWIKPTATNSIGYISKMINQYRGFRTLKYQLNTMSRKQYDKNFKRMELHHLKERNFDLNKKRVVKQIYDYDWDKISNEKGILTTKYDSDTLYSVVQTKMNYPVEYMYKYGSKQKKIVANTVFDKNYSTSKKLPVVSKLDYLDIKPNAVKLKHSMLNFNHVEIFNQAVVRFDNSKKVVRDSLYYVLSAKSGDELNMSEELYKAIKYFYDYEKYVFVDTKPSYYLPSDKGTSLTYPAEGTFKNRIVNKYLIAELINYARGYGKYPMKKHFRDYTQEEYKHYLREMDKRIAIYYGLDTSIVRPHVYLTTQQYADKLKREGKDTIWHDFKAELEFNTDTIWHTWEDRIYDRPSYIYNRYKVKKVKETEIEKKQAREYEEFLKSLE